MESKRDLFVAHLKSCLNKLEGFEIFKGPWAIPPTHGMFFLFKTFFPAKVFHGVCTCSRCQKVTSNHWSFLMTKLATIWPIASMYGIFTYIYHKKSTIHVGKYTSPMDAMAGFTDFARKKMNSNHLQTWPIFGIKSPPLSWFLGVFECFFLSQ